MLKVADISLNAAVALGAVVFLAYLGYHYYDFGLFTTLPESIVGFFLRNWLLQYVTLGLVVAAVIAKVPVGRAIKRQEAGKRI